MGKNRFNGAGRTQVLSSTLLSLGLYGMALGGALWLALLLWPYVLQNDVFLWPFFLAMGFVVLASVLMLASLPGLGVHWLLVVGALLISLLAASGQGWLFPNDATYGTAYWSLTYGGAVLVISLALLGCVKGAWPVLRRTLLVTSVGAAFPIALLVLRGPGDWEAPLSGLDVQLVGMVFGVLTTIAGYRLRGTMRKSRSSSN